MFCCIWSGIPWLAIILGNNECWIITANVRTYPHKLKLRKKYSRKGSTAQNCNADEAHRRHTNILLYDAHAISLFQFMHESEWCDATNPQDPVYESLTISILSMLCRMKCHSFIWTDHELDRFEVPWKKHTNKYCNTPHWMMSIKFEKCPYSTLICISTKVGAD